MKKKIFKAKPKVRLARVMASALSDLSDDPGACPGCGSLNACQGECMEKAR